MTPRCSESVSSPFTPALHPYRVRQTLEASYSQKAARRAGVMTSFWGGAIQLCLLTGKFSEALSFCRSRSVGGVLLCSSVWSPDSDAGRAELDLIVWSQRSSVRLRSGLRADQSGFSSQTGSSIMNLPSDLLCYHVGSCSHNVGSRNCPESLGLFQHFNWI